MPKIAFSPTLSRYPQIRISQYTQRLKQDSKASVLNLTYSVNGNDYRQAVSLAKTACNYGGYRFWFICPKCHKRVGVLYCVGAFFCRHCIGANYASQLEQPYDRLFRKVEKIRHRLQWQAGIAHGHGAKPKGMHYKTYFKLVWEHDRLVNAICGATYEYMERNCPFYKRPNAS